MKELAGKIILVTGASQGIGKSIVQVCARNGAHMIASSIESGLLEEIVESLPGGKDRHLAIPLDVRKESDRQNAFLGILNRYGKLHGLVNNAGIDYSRPFLDTNRSDWDQVLEVDLHSVFELCKRAIPIFLDQGGGNIVNISSVHTQASYQGAAPYAAAKGAINMFSKSLACEFAGQGIRINCVAPGITRTKIWEEHVRKHGSESAALQYWKRNIPSGKIVEPEEVGELVSFLISDRCPNMSGSVIYLDGGLTSQLIASES